jgi:hypothetical protein
LPNTADHDWKIDIRKSVARPPLSARHRLLLFAEVVRKRAQYVFAFRGGHGHAGEPGAVTYAWQVIRSASGIRYRIDATHPAVAAVLENAGALSADIKAMLRVIEETVPVQQIWLDVAEAKDTPLSRFQEVPPEETQSIMKTVFRNLVQRKGFTEDQARRQMAASEPFNQWPELVKALTINEV